MIREPLRILATAIAFSVSWGVIEASYRFMTTYYVHAFHRPASGFKLFLAAILNYAILGALLGLAAAGLRLIVGFHRAGRALRALPFCLASLIGFGAAAQGLYLAKRHLLQGVHRAHPLTWLAVGGALAGAVVATTLLYRLLSRLQLAAVRSGRGRRLAAVAVGLPLAFVLLGLLRGVLLPPDASSTGGAPPAASTPSATPAARGSHHPNIVLLTIETLRADHLNYMGYEARETSPGLDRLARRGVAFTRAYAQAPWTKPTMASLFSSLYPRQHGMVRMGTGLAADAPTLPKALNEAGYHTTTLYTSKYSWSPTFGFTENLRFPRRDPYYVSPISAAPFAISRLQRVILLLTLRLSFPAGDRAWYVDAQQFDRGAREWLDRRPPQPFLLHIHYLDPHEPYFEHPYPLLQFDPRAGWNRESLVRRYDGEIRFVDRAIESLIDDLERRGLLEDAIVVINADHGEEFLDHGGWGHRHHLHGELLHVPLILLAPGRLPADLRLDAPVSTVDIAPTILDLAGIAIPEGFVGRSLVPFVRGEALPERPVLSQLTELLDESDSFLSGEWKLIRTRGRAERRALFHLPEDQDELRDLAASRPEELRRLEESLDALLSLLDRSALPGQSETLTEEEREQLKSLGYVE